jgi:hypothetical protein
MMVQTKFLLRFHIENQVSEIYLLEGAEVMNETNYKPSQYN